MHEKTKFYAKEAVKEFADKIDGLVNAECNTRTYNAIQEMTSLAKDLMLLSKVLKNRKILTAEHGDANSLLDLCERKAKMVLEKKL